MPLLGFKKKFAPDVESGKKRQTIRARRKYPIKVGDTLYLYTGLRTKGCKKLGEAVCEDIRHIIITEGSTIVINGKIARWKDQQSLAEADGFKEVSELVYFFFEEHGLPFEGHIINW